MIHVFHGFLGSPEDFSFLRDFPGVILHDLYEENVGSISIGPQDTLIGYSMGGRIAMEIASLAKFELKKLVIINAHPGLPLRDEIPGRKVWEESVIERLENMSSTDFLEYWNKLPLFDADEPLVELSMEKQAKSLDLFKQHRLSQQKCFLDELQEHRNKVLWIAGERDSKYSEVAKEFIVRREIPCRFIEGGHRLYQQPKKLLELLIAEGIL